MSAWVIWVIVAGGLMAVEALTLSLVLAMAAAGALAAAVAAAAGAGPVVQLVVFTVVTAATLLVVRPVAKRHLHTPTAQRTGIAALAGQTASVLERVDGDGGRVKLAGEVWSARAWDGSQVMEPGDRVQVVEIEGATALVLKGD